MDRKELYEKIRSIAEKVKLTMGGSNQLRHIEQAKNILFNNIDDIVQALQFSMDEEQQLKTLNVVADDQEREIDELQQKNIELTAQVEELTAKLEEKEATTKPGKKESKAVKNPDE